MAPWRHVRRGKSRRQRKSTTTVCGGSTSLFQGGEAVGVVELVESGVAMLGVVKGLDRGRVVRTVPGVGRSVGRAGIGG